ncbi:MAG: hypothetical protein PHC30_06640, partial [Lentisphaeria bacterium]|nr:hypothetical protein [Lentisphaeria bacterium]
MANPPDRARRAPLGSKKSPLEVRGNLHHHIGHMSQISAPITGFRTLPNLVFRMASVYKVKWPQFSLQRRLSVDGNAETRKAPPGRKPGGA